MYKLAFYVPIKESELVKNALFEAGAGRIGHYECCSFETLGTGQFRPMAGARPAIGSIGRIEKVEELKIEMICSDDNIQNALKALRESHPYEEPAFEVIKLTEF